MRITGTILLAFALLEMFLSASSASAQDGDYRSVAIKTKTGYLWVCNEPNNWYTLEIQAAAVSQTSAARKVFNVDGMFLQVVTANTNKFLGDQKKQTLDDQAILQAHRDWEAKYTEGTYKEKLAIESAWQKLASGKDALLWQFNVPQNVRTNVKKEIYLTVVKGDYVLMLGGIATDEIKEEASIKLLLTTMSSLKVSDKPIELNQLKASIRKGD